MMKYRHGKHKHGKTLTGDSPWRCEEPVRSGVAACSPVGSCPSLSEGLSQHW